MLIYLGIYLAFLLIVTALYYSVPAKLKHLVLFASSIGFIAYFSWEIALFALIFGSINYLLGIILEKNRGSDPVRLKLFWATIVFDIGFLAFFKYFGFFNEAFNGIVAFFNGSVQWSMSSVIFPLGISYYTFQTLGYIIRINRGSEKAEKDFFKFITYLVFFPKFFSGPVERSNRFLPQMHNLAKFKKENITDGLRLFLWGAFKKIVISANLYWPIQQVYNDVTNYSGFQLILVFFVQTIYIYTEFSGYTDMALGSAKVLGINLVDNFNRPFLARNVSEFWRRWHISLSSWCNDFIYSPFMVKYRKHENFAIVGGVFLTFFTIGIWHAANWTFVVLGLLQAIAIVYEFYTKKFRLKFASRYSKSSVNGFSRVVVFVFVSFSMVFFFSTSIGDSWYFLSHMFDFGTTTVISTLEEHKLAILLSLTSFALIFVFEMLNEKGKNQLAFFLKQPIWLQLAGYALLIAAICFSETRYLPIEYMKF